ncbi:hypothetical protein JCM14720_15730 [Calditerricola yamamurae]|jgi:hypothetical protein|nr:hypothetical protein [Bacillota bacterium]
MDVRDISWHHKDDSELPAARAPQKGAPLSTQQPRTGEELPVDRTFLADRDAGLMEDPHLLAHVPFDDAGNRFPPE